MRRLSGGGIAKRGGLATVEARLMPCDAAGMSTGVKFLALLPLLMAVPDAGGAPLSCTPGPFVVFFAHGSSALDQDSQEILDNVFSQRGNCGSSKALLAGHTDTSEPASLSRKRVVAVGAYLERLGIPKSAIKIRWFGSDRLRVPTPPATAERQNRRVEMIYYGIKSQ